MLKREEKHALYTRCAKERKWLQNCGKQMKYRKKQGNRACRIDALRRQDKYGIQDIEQKWPNSKTGGGLYYQRSVVPG